MGYSELRKGSVLQNLFKKVCPTKVNEAFACVRTTVMSSLLLRARFLKAQMGGRCTSPTARPLKSKGVGCQAPISVFENLPLKQ